MRAAVNLKNYGPIKLLLQFFFAVISFLQEGNICVHISRKQVVNYKDRGLRNLKMVNTSNSFNTICFYFLIRNITIKAPAA